MEVEDVVVANSDYTAANDDEVSVKAGDIVEVLDTKTALGSKWLVRVLEDVAGGEVVSRQGWLPAAVLQQERVAEQDVTALAARRQAVVRELIETEEEFGRDMQQVASRYMRPMDKATTPKVVFDNRELLFSNFKQITEFHSTALLEGIKYYAGEPCMLGRALLRMEREFDKHVAYCRDEPRAQHLLQHDPVVAHYFQDLADKLGDDKGLTEHLKLPIQRINDYQLLLKELVKYSQRIGDDSADLQKALELFLGVPNRATDNKFIASIEGYRGNIYKLGRLLTHDWFTVTDQQGQSKERYLFLFKARLLICKVKRVSDDRSVFVLKDIIKLPETEAVDRPEDPFRFELRSLAGGITLAAHKEPVKPAWLREIRQYSSDLVALAEHAADDLQVLSPPQVTSPEPEEKKKKREREEDIPETKEKRTKVEADSLQVESQTAKRKASLETEVASKISKSEVTEVSSSDVQSVHAKTEVTTGLETKSSVTASVSEVSQSVSQSQSTQQTVVAASIEKTEAKATLIAKVEEKSFVQSQQSSVEQAEFVETSKQTSQSSQQVSVQQASTETSEKAKEIRTASSSTIEEKSSVQSQQSIVEQTQSVDTSNQAVEQVSVQQASVEKAKENKSLSSASAGEQKKVSTEKSSTDVEQKSLETTQISSEVKSQSSAEIKSQISSKTKSQTSVEVSKQQESAKSSDAKSESSVEVSKQQESVKSSDAKSQASVELNKQQESAKSSDAKSQSSVEVKKQQESATSSDVKSQSSVEVKNQQETAQAQVSTESKTQSTVESKSKETSQSSVQSVQQTSTTKVESVEESHILTREESLALLRASRKASFGTDKTQESVQSSTEVVTANVEESSEVKVVGSAEGATVEEKVPAGGQTVTAEDATDDMSRYSRSSRLSGDYSSSSRRYESSGGYESSGLSSSYSRRESGSRYESAASAEGSAATRIESKYSSARVEGGSKYSVEGDEAVSKLDSIASKYGIESSYGSARSERTASKYSVDLEDDKLEAITSKRESRYESKNGDATLESKYSRSAVANGSVTNEFQSTKSILKSESGDGRPVFTKTLSGQNIEPGENAAFECQLRESLESSRVTWLKDNRPLTDKLMDRVNVSSRSGQNRLEIMHCREDDSGVYTARAENTKGNAHCTAQLVVIELTAEERRERNALNAPYFLVALKDTEILLNTYLRFMVKVKGDPTPDVTFYRYGKEIKTTSESDRISINRTLADKGCYELVIADVNHDDAGKYSCKAVNVYGEVETEATVTVVDDKNIFFELPPGGEGLLAKGEKPVFAWKRDGEPFDPEERFKVLMGEDEDTLALVFQHVRPEDAGLYTCVAKTTTGSISCSAELTVQGAVNELHREPEKPTLIIEHKEAIVSAGASAMLELQCKGFPKPSVVFKHDGKIIEADTRHKFLYEDDESMSLVIKNVSSADAGDYLVTASNELGEDSTTLRLVVKAAPKVKRKVENQTCMVGSTHTVTIEVEGAPEPDVTFYKDGVEIKSSDRIKIVKESSEVYKIIIKDAKLTDTGSYSIVAKNEVNQCSDFWQWHVTSPPRVTKKLGGDKVCDEKQTVTLQIEAEAEPAPTVTWYKNKTELIESSSVKISSSGSAHALVLAAAARADAGEYSCEIRNVHGSASDSCLVQVRGAPIFTQKLRDTTACEGDVNVEFTVAVEAYPEPTVRWYLGDVEITEKKSVFTRVDSGATHKLILKEVSAEYSGRYSCKVSNDLGSDACEATFTVKRKPRFTKSLIDMTVDTGSTLKLEVEVEGTPEPKVKWFKDGKEVNLDARIKIERDTQRLENYYLTVNIVKEEDGGEYEVTAENEMGSVSSKSTVTVHTPPTIKDSSMKDSCVYESLPLVYTVSAVGAPQPVVKWLHNGKEVKQNAHVHISKEGDLYKLAIDSVEMADAGKWQCEISNDLGKKVQNAELSVNSVSEFRKPIFTTPLEAQQVMQREPVTLQAVCTADPQPHVSWLLNGVELTPDATIVTSAEAKDIEHGLKECTFKLHIPTGRHADTGVYTIKAKNQYGVGESSARLDILLRPEIEGLKDVTAVPYEETTFVANIRANPVAEVKWSKDGYAIQPSTQYDVVADTATEQYKLVVKSVGVGDAGVYTVTAKNEHGETAQQAKLTVHTNEPVFTKPLQKETVKDYDDATLKVRCDGVPKPEVHWYKDGVEIENDERRTVTTVVGGQVDSELAIQHFNASDAGKYKVRAMNLAGEASCEAAISLAAAAPGFAQRLDRQRDVDEGEPLELKCKLDGSPVPKAKWYKDGAELSPADPRIVQTALPDGSIKLSIARATPADCGAYKLVVSNPHGENSALCAVAVNPTPRRPSFSQELEDVKAVVGQPLKLEARVMAFPAPEVKWFKDGLPIRPSQAVNFINQPGGLVGLSIDAAKPEDAGVYRVTVANKLGEIASQATVEVGLKERKPAFIAELMPTKVIEGFPVKLEVKVLGHPQPTIKWTHNGKEIIPDGQRIKVISTPDGSHALLISEAAAADAGEYGVVAINDKGETGCKAKLDVASRANDSSPQERPQLIHGLRDVTAEEGQPLLLSAPFVGNPVPDVAWTKDGVPLKPSERVLITCDGRRVGIEIEPVDLADAGVYGVRLTNPLGEDASEGTVHVRKVYQPPAFTQKFTDLQQLPTFDGKFPARVSGVPTPEISWYKDGQPLRHTDKYNIKRDGDACCLYVRDLTAEDAGRYKCVAKNREGEATCEANLDVVDKIARKQKIEPPYFLKRIGDTEVLRGMSAKFTACAAGEPEPDVEWYRNDERLFPCERIRMDKETTGLLRLTVSGVDPNTDVGVYKCRIYNPHGEEACTARLSYDSLEPQQPKRPISDQYSDFDKMKKTGIPMPLADKPIISRMADRHLTLSWKPSIPHGPRFPVTYQVEMCEQPDGDWFTARTGLRSCVCDIRNLVPFRDYKFRVRVENQYGVSDPSPFAITHRAKLEPDPPKFIPYLEPGIDFRPETSPYFPKDFDIERPPHDQHAAAPRFLRQEHDSQYGVKGHNVNLFWFVYGYPKPKMTYFYNDEPIEIGGRYDWSYTRNGQATLFINKMLERDAGWYEAVATNEHGQARQRVRLEIAEYPYFIKRPEETVALQRRPARLEARVTGVPYPDIKWYKDWQPLAASARIKIKFIEPDTTILVINDAILKDEGLYSVSARNVAGSASASAMLHIEEDEHEYSDRIRAHPPRVSCSTKPFGELYDLGDELGRGVQGVAYHAAERLTGRNYAAKIMHGHSALKPFMKNELEIMNMLNDRHLVRLHDAYEHDHTLAIVMELAAGGELVRDRLLRSQGYSEREIAGYIRQLLRGLKYMHENSVAHLGLTIGELLLSHAGSDQLKICDFGLSRRIQFSKHGALDYGMPEYVAPEVASGDGVSFAADMWSVGIITYILLSGHSPFRGAHDRETLTRIREGKWAWHDEEWWSRLSTESRDFISKLLVFDWNSRMDVNAALSHPWLNLADKIYQDEYLITTDRLRNYYNLYRDWTSNAACRNWFRRRPLSGAFDHPSKMVYPPGEIYTPEGTPERDPHARSPAAGDLQFKQWDHPDWEVSAKSESHYQNGPDTYLLQLRDTQFPVRLREYMKVACHRSPAYYISVNDTYDPRTPIIRERRRFTDIMDEEIDDERRERINNYGNDRSYIIRRLRHELGTRLDSYAEAQAIMEAKKDGQLPFFREKPQIAAIVDGEPARLRCYAVGDPRPSVQWFKNDNVVAPGPRVDVVEDDEGRSTLSFNPARLHDVGFYKVVARNKVGQTVARARVVEASSPDAPDSPVPVQVSDTEVLLRWKQPKYDGNSPVQCYSLQYKRGDSVEWQDVGFNIDHEFYLVRDLAPDTSYQFRLSSRNKIAWSEKGIPTECVKTAASGAPKLVISKAMMHLQQMTESGQPIEGDEEKPRLSYNVENSPLDWDTTDAFTERYSFISELWRGKFSIVVKGVDKNTDSVVVAKILENRPDTEVQIQREFECLRRLRHERISNLLAAYQAPGSPVTAFILEKLQGADILTYLSSRHSYTEQVVATIVAQLLDGLQYLHWRGFCHLDLQPDNVVMASVRSVQVKLVDFGSAHKVSKLGTVVPQVGDLDYKSPEVVNDEPAFPQTDIWSVGVLAYVMLSGVSPFRGENDQETKQNISFVRYQFEHLYKEISQEATRFLMFLFKKVPQKRPSADECHEHRWLAQSDFMNKKRERTHFLGHRLRQFSEEYHERKAREASQADTVTAAFGKMQPRHLTRSNSIQEELETTFANVTK